MKIMRCQLCKGERLVEDNILIVICKCCQVEMLELKEEDNKDGYRTLKL